MVQQFVVLMRNAAEGVDVKRRPLTNRERAERELRTKAIKP
jgi:hypothetical protein